MLAFKELSNCMLKKLVNPWLNIIDNITPINPILQQNEARNVLFLLYFKKEIASYGVFVLEGEKCEISKGAEKITIYGVQDPESLKGEKYGYREINILEKLLAELDYQNEGYNILLSHRPEGFDFYTEYGYDLVLCGHAHGGQFRLPIIGAVYAPGQGFFPKLTEGMHTKNNTTMIVSRGLGNSSIPVRFNNTPELVLITLEK